MVNPLADRPLHRQLADILRDRIDDGEFPPGSHLPSEVDLAHGYSVSRDVVRDALALLRAEGLVLTSTQGRNRIPQPRAVQVVPVPADSVVSARMPTDAERYEDDIPEGVPVLTVRTGGQLTIYPADRITLRADSTA